MNNRLEILPVTGIGDVTEGDDLAELITTAAPWLADGDVLVVTSKIVSKAEGRLVDVPADGPERLAAREEILAAETARRVATRGNTRIVQTHHGFVMASAGIDASNVDPTRLVLLPKDPDASARALRATLRERHGLDVAVIVSDTMGRPWRNGLTDVALGVAGMDAIRDHRGEVDPYGNELHITQMAVVDELAGAGELIKGKCDQVPVAVVRGYLPAGRAGGGDLPAGRAGGGYLPSGGAGDGAGATVLVRDATQDLFSLGTAEAKAAGLLAAATLTDTPVVEPADPHVVRRAVDTVRPLLAPGTRITVAAAVATPADPAAQLVGVAGLPAGATLLVRCVPAPTDDPAALIHLGTDTQRLRTALAAHGVPSTLLSTSPDGVTLAV